MKTGMLRLLPIAFLAGASLAAATCDAQGFPGGRGQGHGRNSADTNDPAAAARRGPASPNATVTEPAIALERELPSLRTDLLLDATQVDAWKAFEGAVRDAAQAAHARQRRTVEQRQAAVAAGVDLPPGAGINSLQRAIDDERSRADLLARVVDTLDALNRVLEPRQGGMINRRVVQALRDPLGSS